MEAQCRELGVDDPSYWAKVRGLLTTVLMPRYASLAREEIKLSRAGYHLWRGGDLVARLAFAAVGLLLGAAAVEIPWIPVQEKWVPWLLFVGGPMLPDAQLWFYRRRHAKRLKQLIADLAGAGASLDTYRSIAELQQTLGAAAPEPSIEPESNESRAPRDSARLKH